jgi:hypothetical protein
MKVTELESILKEEIPKNTTLFNANSVNINSLTFNSGSVTAVTASVHSFNTNDYVTISDAKIPIAINSLSQLNGLGLLLTNDKHFITKGVDNLLIDGANEADYNGTFSIAEAPTVDIESITTLAGVATVVTKQKHGFVVNSNFIININSDISEYNKEFSIASIIDENTFTINVLGTPKDSVVGSITPLLNRYIAYFEIDKTAPSTATGSPILIEDRYNWFNGRYKITKVNDTTFTYAVADKNLPASAIGNIKVTNVNITGVLDINLFNKNYINDNNKYWLVGEMGEFLTNRNKRIAQDANDIRSDATSAYQSTYQNFTVYFVGSYQDDKTGMAISDLAQDVRAYLLKTLDNYKPTTNLNGGFRITYVNDSPFESPFEGIAIHEYNFQINGHIEDCNVNNNVNSIPINTAEINYKDNFNNIAKTDTINFD